MLLQVKKKSLIALYSIASFVNRAIEQIKIDLCMKLPVKIFGVGSGYSYAVDGPTHHATEDIGLLNLMPNGNFFPLIFL